MKVPRLIEYDFQHSVIPLSTTTKKRDATDDQSFLVRYKCHFDSVGKIVSDAPQLMLGGIRYNFNLVFLLYF